MPAKMRILIAVLAMLTLIIGVGLVLQIIRSGGTSWWAWVIFASGVVIVGGLYWSTSNRRPGE